MLTIDVVNGVTMVNLTGVGSLAGTRVHLDSSNFDAVLLLDKVAVRLTLEQVTELRKVLGPIGRDITADGRRPP